MGSLPHVVEDCGGVVQLLSDGTVFRSKEVGFPMPIVNDDSIIFKDCLFDKTHSLHLRLYKPTSSISATGKLSVVLYLHGGGFCAGTRDWPNFHNSCLRLSSGLKALIVAPDYRLAPEHKLPAPMEDGLCALRWLQAQVLSEKGDAWINGSGVDFDQVFILGDSSGGNMAHHLAVQLGAGSTGLAPVRVRGYILLAPFFGGVARTKSEDGPSEQLLNLEILDRFWRLSMPAGASRDHPWANPFGPGSLNLEQVAIDPILVIVGSCELLRDRAEDYAKRLKEMRKKIEYVEFEGKQHSFFTNDPYSEASEEVIRVMKKFMLENSC